MKEQKLADNLHRLRKKQKMLFYSTAVPMKSRNSFTALKRKERQKMNILMLNGSPRKNGNTAIALEEMKKVFEADHAWTHFIR